MLKIVVFDSGYGGELFADLLSDELPVAEIIRVIDWRDADKILDSPRQARKIAERCLRPYINQVDLIIFANHLLSITSLKYFKRKYKSQKFLGLDLRKPDTFVKKDLLILTTKAVAKTITFHNFVFQLKRKTTVFTLDDWPGLIDDGELDTLDIKNTLEARLLKNNLESPTEIILACSQFNDIKRELKNIFGQNLRIYDSFDEALRAVFRALHLRGGMGKKK